MQQTGRAGRDNKPAEATLYFSNADTGNTLMRPEMRLLCKQSSCHRRHILSYFEDNSSLEGVGHKCCSFCEKQCTCENCAINRPCDEPMGSEDDNTMTTTLNTKIQANLYNYMGRINREIEDLCGCDGQIISGLTPSVMDDISCHPNETVSSLKQLYGYLKDEHLVAIASILSVTNME